MDVKTRQDAWTHENDVLLAETVLRHVREGSTQLNAFEEVGDLLNRTSAACGFRWNAVIRHKYEHALQLAKKYRKEKKRAESQMKSGKERKNLLYTPPMAQLKEPIEQVFHNEMQTEEKSQDPIILPSAEIFVTNDEKIEENHKTGVPTQPQGMYIPEGKKLEIGDVIAFLMNIKQQTSQSSFIEYENMRLKKEIHSLQAKIQGLETQIKKLESEANTMHEDYDTVMKILNRARKLVLFDEEDSGSVPTFKMDKNGNLEKVAD
ncbi:MAG TPA: RsfA family transcriptional regulator [Firmicutes bacterium]|nr:RsfA family transcriptional regulator [Bacillales bacterium]HJA41141.1 RsfA family transcriptional regulator [Bacillota bacterium]